MNIETLLEKAQQGDASAKAELRARAQNGEAAALWAMGEMYAAGQGLPQNADKAAECFRRAAEQGHEKARETLARMEGGGDGKFEALLDKAKQSDEQAWEDLENLLDEEAKKTWEKVWDYGDEPEGEGIFSSEVYNRVFDAFREKAEEGDAFAQYAVGRLFWKWGLIYNEDGNDIPKWHYEAHEWLRSAADRGYAGAQCRVGNHYLWGDVGNCDFSEAITWFHKAAAQGNLEAFSNLCEICSDPSDCGKGLDDEEEAEKVQKVGIAAMHALAACGHEGAREWLDERGEDCDDEEDEEDVWGQREIWFQAAQNGDKSAFGKLMKLAQSYLEELDNEDSDEASDRLDIVYDWVSDVLIPDDREKVMVWFRELAEQGNVAALRYLKWRAIECGYPSCTLRCLVEMADAGSEKAQEALQLLGPEWEGWEDFDMDEPMECLREAANAGSEWGKKSYEAVLAYLRGEAEAGEDWAQRMLAEQLRAAGAK